MAELNSGMYATMEPSEKLQYACGGIVVAGLLYVILAAIIKAVGVHRVMHFLPPVVTGPIIILIGLNLAPSAVSNASTCWWLALVSMAIIIVANIWGKRHDQDHPHPAGRGRRPMWSALCAGHGRLLRLCRQLPALRLRTPCWASSPS